MVAKKADLIEIKIKLGSNVRVCVTWSVINQVVLSQNDASVDDTCGLAWIHEPHLENFICHNEDAEPDLYCIDRSAVYSGQIFFLM